MLTQKTSGSNVRRIARLLPVLAGIACALASPVLAQQSQASTPQFEVSAAYSFVRANPGNSNGGFNLNGGSGSLAYNFSDRFSAVADVGGYRFSGLPSGVDSTMYTYLFGPRYSFRRDSRLTPFAQVLLGAGHVSASSGNLNAGENAFAMAAGGGIDFRFRSSLAIRPIQVEYLMTRFTSVSGVSETQNDVRISAGVVIRFGSR